jgi:hypothetical protein
MGFKIYTLDLTWELRYYIYEGYEFSMVDVFHGKMSMSTEWNQDYLLGIL